jgi:hypothetical protein
LVVVGGVVWCGVVSLDDGGAKALDQKEQLRRRQNSWRRRQKYGAHMFVLLSYCTDRDALAVWPASVAHKKRLAFIPIPSGFIPRKTVFAYLFLAVQKTRAKAKR